MNAFTQYLKDTRAELHHVAWPTQGQTIVYTGLVAGISVGVALYLGFFDFLFTSGLANIIQNVQSQNPITVTQQPATSTPVITPTTTPQAPKFNI